MSEQMLEQVREAVEGQIVGAVVRQSLGGRLTCAGLRGPATGGDADDSAARRRRCTSLT